MPNQAWVPFDQALVRKKSLADVAVLQELRWVTFVPPLGEVLYPVIWVDVIKVDVAWQQSELYISNGGGWAGDPERYEKFGKWMERKEPIQIASLGLFDEVIEFNDGRYRFAWLRDHGVKIMPVHVDPDKVELVKSRFEVVVGLISPLGGEAGNLALFLLTAKQLQCLEINGVLGKNAVSFVGPDWKEEVVLDIVDAQPKRGLVPRENVLSEIFIFLTVDLLQVDF